ncbi:histidine-tRNA ligase [Mycena floridula]|nr:histidine-tRNA ligase [Mycena floridula]
MASTDSLADQISQQQKLLNELRSQPNSDAAVLDAVKKTLGELKKAQAQAIARKTESTDASTDAAAKKRERLLLKTAKGTRDFGPQEMFCREHIERLVKDVFTTYGGSCLDTPVFERKDILTGKYGEDAKLIFDLMDQGGEQLALRYDHTVPLARYLAMNGVATGQKLWQLGKVYRRDQPVMSKGRMREFTQADFDITGPWDAMIPDSEVISLVCAVLTKLDVGDFTVKVNHRKILDGIFEICGVPADKIRTISSAVDKLDKMPWLEVKKEMTDEKGLDPAIADRIGEYVKLKGPGATLLPVLTANSALMANASAKAGVEDMKLLFQYLEAYGVNDKMSFDLSLARGLDYYTGIIYEAIVEASAPPGFDGSADAPMPKKKKVAKTEGADGEEEIDESQVGVGSIAAGGRYDGLVGMFTAAASGDSKGKKTKTADMPCVGVSFGLERIFSLLYPKWVERGMRKGYIMVYVMAAGDGLLVERIGLVKELRAAGIKCDFLAKNKPKLPAQFSAGEKEEVPFAIILGADELKAGLVTVKEQKWELVEKERKKIESADKGVQVQRSELINWLKGTSTYEQWSSGRW